MKRIFSHRLPLFRTFSLIGLLSLALTLQITADVSKWQARAVQEYPALGEQGSPFNQRFLERHAALKESNPAFFNDARWPWLLAREVNEELSAPQQEEAAVVETEAPAPEVAAAPTTEPKELHREWEEMKPSPDLGLEKAIFRWWEPEGTPIRGVLVLAPGRGGDGRGMADDPKWQAIAREVQFGLMACFLKNRADMPFAYQENPNGGTSALVAKAVDELLALNGHSMKNAPLAFYGHSAGANVSQKFANIYPKRVVAAVIMRCPSGPGDYSPAKGEIPMLVVIGGKDKKEWVEYSVKQYENANQKRALWTLALNPNEGHGLESAWEVSETFLRTTIPQRLEKPVGNASGPAKIVRLSRNDGWLGDTETYEIGAGSQYKGKKANATWIPNEEVAEAWKKHLTP